MTEYINKAPTATIFDSLVKAKSVLASHHNILVSVSGGADSDCMIDIVHNLSPFEEELKILHKYEPKLASAVEHIFAPSYEYTRAYRKFKESRKKKHD